MTDRTGWHCTACNRFGQVTGDEVPVVCPRCGTTGAIRRIDHPDPSIPVAAGDVISCLIVGETERHVVGEVVRVEGDRVLVEADDGTGRYAVKPAQIETVRRSVGASGGRRDR